MADKITELHQEESLAVLKDISDKLSQTGNAELFKHIEMVKGDKGDSGIGIKSIDSETLDSSVVIKIEKTDGELISFEVERLKGIDGIDGIDGKDGVDGIDGIDGAPGKDGQPGKIGKQGLSGKDGRSFKWRGEWQPATSYNIDDVVEYRGSSFIAVKSNTGTYPDSSDNWNLVAKRGSDGRNGVDGVSSGGGSTSSGSGSSAWGGITGDIASQTDLQTALSAKANTSSLAAVATSGSYADLSSKPSIPATFDDLSAGTTNKAYTATEKTKLAGIAAGAAVNVQPDWNEVVNTADDYIKNKPTIPTNNNQLTNGAGYITSYSETDPVFLASQAHNITSTDITHLSNLSGTNTGDQDLSGLVPKTTTVNGHALSANVTVTKGDVSLGNVDNTSNATERAAVATLTNKDLTSGTNTFPTFNQNTTGSAAKLTTARNIAGVAFDGTASITLASTNLSDTASIVLLTSTQTLSNKRNTPRVGTTTSSATPTINTDNVDIYTITAQAAAITSFTTNLSGTPNNGDKLIISITDNGTSRAITWGASFESSTIILPTATVVSTRLDVAFIWNVATSKWRCIGVA